MKEKVVDFPMAERGGLFFSQVIGAHSGE